MEKTRLVIADDQSLITQSFKVLLETAAADIEVVGTARDGREAAVLVEKQKPDIVLLDVRMPVMDGVHAADAIHRAHPDVKIIMLTTFDDDTYVHEAIRAGAVGYLLKDISTEELISSIRAVKHGAVLVSSTLAQKLFPKEPEPPLNSAIPQASNPVDPDTLLILKELSKREIEILRLIVLGYENKEIAEKLFAADQTIKNSVSALYTKLGVENRKEARRFALKSGLVQPGDFLRNP
ncbi:MAG: response regulator transcription factor [Spirochaetia bacterium]|jgi:DNA-binding NarL/FixJ family response regulator